jgi:hypothetical protein
VVDQPDPAQGQLVLAAPAAPTGASRRPAVTAEASCRRAAAPTRPIVPVSCQVVYRSAHSG